MLAITRNLSDLTLKERKKFMSLKSAEFKLFYVEIGTVLYAQWTKKYSILYDPRRNSARLKLKKNDFLI